jgi:hypothetical protein
MSEWKFVFIKFSRMESKNPNMQVPPQTYQPQQYPYVSFNQVAPEQIAYAPMVQPPSYYQSIQMQTPKLNDYNPNLVPDSNILTPGTCQPLDHPTSALFKKGNDLNIISFDPNLDSDEKELWRFFMSHLQPPKYYIRIRGWHTEHRTRTVYRDGNSHTEHYTVDVDDFLFQLDMSHHVSPGWARIICVPAKGEVPLTFEQTLKQYATSSSKLKL